MVLELQGYVEHPDQLLQIVLIPHRLQLCVKHVRQEYEPH